MTSEQMPLARDIFDRVAPGGWGDAAVPDPDPGPLVDALEATAREYREAYRRDPLPQPWYVNLPAWVVHRDGRTFEQFAAEFDESAKRTHIPLVGVAGFEVEYHPGQVRRHRIGWLDGGAQTPGEEEIDV